MSKLFICILVVAIGCFATSQAVVWCTTTAYCQDGHICCWAPSLSQYTCCPSLYKCCSGGLKCCASFSFLGMGQQSGIRALKSETPPQEMVNSPPDFFNML